MPQSSGRLDRQRNGTMEYDRRWVPTREISGKWLAERFMPSRVPGRSDELVREVDGRWWKGELLPKWHDTLEQCQARCDELNG
jgi:hypothetical protein